MKFLLPVRLSLIVFFLVQAYALPEHPRLLVTEEDWGNLPARMESDPIVEKIVKTCIGRADQILDKETLVRELEGRRLLAVSREAIMRVLDLSTAWKVTKNKRYLERCRDELIAICGFIDWNPSHHLDTSEMQTAVAIGYDWLYHDLDPADRKIIKTALVEKGFKISYADKRVRKRTNNWNQVCNGGLIFSSIALLDVEPELAEKAIKEAVSFIPIALDHSYPPDGAYAEGGGYWTYGTIYSVLSIEALAKAGFPAPAFARHGGLMASGDYKAQVFGTSGLLFNYGDNRVTGVRPISAMSWMVREKQSASLYDFLLPAFQGLSVRSSDRFLAFAAFWLPDADELKKDRLAMHFHGTGNSPIAIHRTGFCDHDLFLGIKAGKASVNHGQMDAGSFVLDFLGKRWALDLGLQNYHLLEKQGISLFNPSPDSDRWTVFRLNNFSHNTLTYNDKLHDVDGAARIISSNNDQTILDLTESLGLPKGASARRTFQVNPDGPGITIIDTLSGLNLDDTIDWNMLTRAKVMKRDHGFELEMSGQKLHLNLSASNASSSSSKPIDPPSNEHDQNNPGVHQIKLRATASASGKIEITAVFRKPGSD